MSAQPEVETGTPEAVAADAESAPAETPSRKVRVIKKSGRQMLAGNWRLVSAAVMLVIGIVLVLLGWYGAANTNILTEQIPYLISGGLLGLGLIIVAGVLASSAALERENRELRADLRRMVGGGGRMGVARMTAEPLSGEGAGANGQLYVVPGGRSYHAAGCPILEGKQGVKELPREQAPSYAACKLCEPDSD